MISILIRCSSDLGGGGVGSRGSRVGVGYTELRKIVSEVWLKKCCFTSIWSYFANTIMKNLSYLGGCSLIDQGNGVPLNVWSGTRRARTSETSSALTFRRVLQGCSREHLQSSSNFFDSLSEFGYVSFILSHMFAGIVRNPRYLPEANIFWTIFTILPKVPKESDIFCKLWMVKTVRWSVGVTKAFLLFLSSLQCPR